MDAGDGMTRHCEARIGVQPGAFGFAPVTCRQRVGLRPIIDASGTVRRACERDGHEHDVIRRFGSRCCGADASTPHWVHCPEHPRAMGEATAAVGR